MRKLVEDRLLAAMKAHEKFFREYLFVINNAEEYLTTEMLSVISDEDLLGAYIDFLVEAYYD